MKDTFVPTRNHQRLTALCDELLDGPGRGVEMAEVIGRSGRGKTTSAEKIFSVNENTVYVLYQEAWSHTELLRDITFRLCGVRPRFRQVCFDMIQNEMAAKRRIILVDEADRMPLKCLNILRNIHDICKIPVVFIGEDELKPKLARERRLMSRLRDIIEFGPITGADIVVFFRQSLDAQLPSKSAVKLLQHSKGDFRNVLTQAVKAERIMKASGITTLTERIVDEICKNGRKNS